MGWRGGYGKSYYTLLESVSLEKIDKLIFKMPMREITQLSSSEARSFFLKDESYCSFDTPAYFEFEPLLRKVWDALEGSELHSFYRPLNSPDGEPNTLRPNRCTGVNFSLLRNKDGRFAWRSLQLIHPVLYVKYVKEITSDENWEHLKTRLSYFQSPPQFSAHGIPVKASPTDESDTAATIKKWWKSVETKSLELGIDYDYIIHTDISDCYESIYTHSIPWSLHTKDSAKRRRRDYSLAGICMDRTIRNMCNGQTNGIPQGSRLMDLVAELVLGYADIKLYRRLFREGIDEYHIIRFRDDYRIYVSNPQDGQLILKILLRFLLI
jgi:hypothetical protein